MRDLSFIWIENKEYEKAEGLLWESLLLEPENANAINELNYIYQSQNIDKCIRVYESSSEMEKKHFSEYDRRVKPSEIIEKWENYENKKMAFATLLEAVNLHEQNDDKFTIRYKVIECDFEWLEIYDESKKPIHVKPNKENVIVFFRTFSNKRDPEAIMSENEDFLFVIYGRPIQKHENNILFEIDYIRTIPMHFVMVTDEDDS